MSPVIKHQDIDSPQRKTGRPKARMALLAGALFGSVLAFGVSPAAAGTTNCPVWANNPTTNGVTSYSYGRMNCGFAGLVNDNIRVTHQEKYFGVWNDRAHAIDSSTNGFGDVDATASYNCNGHGDDDYRTRSIGTDTNGNNKTRYSSTVNLTC